MRPQVVESDHRVGLTQVDIGVQVPQQPVGQRVGQGAQLLLGVLDQRSQRCTTGGHLPQVQLADAQGHREFGGEPAHGARQIDIGAKLIVAAMALDIDADQRADVSSNLAQAKANAINRTSLIPA